MPVDFGMQYAIMDFHLGGQNNVGNQSLFEQLANARKNSVLLARCCEEAIDGTWDCAMPGGADGFEAMRDDAKQIASTLEGMRQFLHHTRKLVNRWPHFDNDAAVSGADLVEWFSEYRERTKTLLGGTMADDSGKPVKVLVTVAGGCVQSVACTCAPAAGIDVKVVDFDLTPGDTDTAPDLDVWFKDGQTARQFQEQVALLNPAYAVLI